MSDFTPAKRGDLVLIETVHRDWVNGEGAREYKQYELYEVTGITRDSHVRGVRDLRYDESTPMELKRLLGVDRRWMISKAQLSVDVARELVQSVYWQHKPDSVKGFWDSYGEAVAAIRRVVTA